MNFGHVTSKTHPDMRPFIAGVRNTVHVFDLEKTREKLDEALEALAALHRDGKTLLLVGTKVQIRNMVAETAEACGIPVVSFRWIGGTLTNFPEITKRVERLKELERQKEEGGWEEKYTKKERLDLSREIEGLQEKFGGLRNLSALPDAIFVCDLDENRLAAVEAKKTGVEVFGIADTNIDPSLCTYAIPANDDAISSVRYILGKIASVFGAALPERPVPFVQEPEQEQEEEAATEPNESEESETDAPSQEA